MHEALTRVFDEIVTPLLARDGGAATFEVNQAGDAITLVFKGHCRGCPGRSLCAEGVVLTALRSVAPELNSVRFR